MINNVAEQNAMRVSTATLNQVINEAIAIVQPPTDKGKRLKILYGTQVSTKPPTFVIYSNTFIVYMIVNIHSSVIFVYNIILLYLFYCQLVYFSFNG